MEIASAFGISVYSVDHFAPILQPELQNPIWRQPDLPSRATGLIAVRVEVISLYPILVPPAFKTLKLLVSNDGGMPWVPLTPILSSALS